MTTAAENEAEQHPQPRHGLCSRIISKMFLQPFIKSNDGSVLWILYLTIFVDLLGASIVIPILPFYAQEFGANSTQVGAILTGYAATQLVAMLIMGPLSDRIGRRPALLINILGSVLGFLAQGLAWNLASFIAFRTASGLFGGSPPIVQALIADLFTPAERPKYLSLVGAVTAAAFTFGPAVGAGLSEFSLTTPMYVGSGVAFFNLLFAMFIIPETNPKVLERYRMAKAKEFVEGRAAAIEAAAATKKAKEVDGDSGKPSKAKIESDSSDSDNDTEKPTKAKSGEAAGGEEKEGTSISSTTVVVDTKISIKVVDGGDHSDSDDHEAFVAEQKARAMFIERVDSFGDPLTPTVADYKSGDMELRKRVTRKDSLGDEEGPGGVKKPLTEHEAKKAAESQPDQVKWNVVIFVCYTQFINVLGFTAFQSMFSLYMDAVFGFGSRELGFIFTGTSVVFMFAQSVLWNALRKKIGMIRSAIIGCALQAAGLALVPLAENIGALIPCIIALAVGFSLVQPMVPSILTQVSPDKDQGRVLSLGSVSGSAARMVGPLALGAIFDINVDYPFLIGGGIAALNFVQLIVVYITKVLPNQPRKPTKEEQNYDDLIENYNEDDLDEWGSRKQVRDLGRFFAALLATRHYRWVSFYPQLKDHLKIAFPPLQPGQRAEGYRALREGALNTWHKHFRTTFE